MAFQNIFGRLVDVIFGYDFFVSYTWADGSKYAHSLYEKLKAQGFTVFLDEEDYARGDNWTLLGRRALKKTRQLILVATPKVHESGPVLKELTAFQSTGRRIVPIEIGDSLDSEKYPESPLLPFIPAELLKINQSIEKDAIPTEAPPEVIRELRRGFQHVRQAQLRIRALFATCLVLLGLLAVAVWQGIRAELQRHEANRQKLEAVKQETIAKEQTKKTREAASRGNVSLARYEIEGGRNAQALADLAQALRLNPVNREASGLTVATVTHLSWPVLLIGSMRHESWVSSAQFSPNSQRVVTASDDKTARLWDAASGKPIGEPMKHASSVSSAQFSPDGQRIVTASGDKTARLWDAATGKPIGEPMNHPDVVNSAQFSPNGQWVVTASTDKTARLWDAATGKSIGEPMKHEGVVNSAQFSPDGQWVVTASTDKTARLWDAATGKPIAEPIRHEAGVWSAQFSPDGQRVLTVSAADTAQLWDVVIVTDKDTRQDILLVVDLAEATGGMSLETVGQADNLKFMTAEQIRASWEKIAAKFLSPPSKMTPLQRFLKWSVSDRRSRTISPLSRITVSEWLDDRIKDGTVEELRVAIGVDPANARVTAHLGRRLFDYALQQGSDPGEARRARGEADFLTSRAVKLAPDNDEVKDLRDQVVKLLGER